jgi:hypothetical protein
MQHTDLILEGKNSQVWRSRGQAAEVIGVTGRNHGRAKLERRGNHERIDGMCRSEPRASEEGARATRCSCRQVHDHDSAPVQNTADEGVARSAATHFGKDGRRDANERPLFVRHLEHRPGAVGKRAALTGSRQRVERLGVED